MINIQDATPQQIAWFKLAAAKRYQERGIAPAQAEQLFVNKMAAIAAALGVEEQAPVNGKVPTVKVAAAIKKIVAARK